MQLVLREGKLWLGDRLKTQTRKVVLTVGDGLRDCGSLGLKA